MKKHKEPWVPPPSTGTLVINSVTVNAFHALEVLHWPFAVVHGPSGQMVAVFGSADVGPLAELLFALGPHTEMIVVYTCPTGPVRDGVLWRVEDMRHLGNPHSFQEAIMDKILERLKVFKEKAP